MKKKTKDEEEKNQLWADLWAVFVDCRFRCLAPVPGLHYWMINKNEEKTSKQNLTGIGSRS